MPHPRPGGSPSGQWRIMMDTGFDCEHPVTDSPVRFALLIRGAPWTSDAPAAALRFARAALAAGHSVQCAFFHGDGAGIANRYATPPQDEDNIAAAWVEFAGRHGVPLTACVASAARRGIMAAGEAQRLELGGATLRDGFELGGLGQLIQAMEGADRTVTFGA